MHKLDYYISKFNHLVEQGSQEWLDGRTCCFGGSEMATLLNKNKYEKLPQLLEKKAKKIVEVSDATSWGHWFEDIAKYFIQQEYGSIYLFGSVPHPFYPICYSPDGVFVENGDLTLLEIKNPIWRGVHTIPEMYLEQVKTGMCIINVKYTLFAQYRFRRCTMKTKSWNIYYDRKYHKEYHKRCPDMKPISYGFLYWDDPNVKVVDLCKSDNICKTLKQHARKMPEVRVEDETFDPKTGYVLKWKLFEFNHTGIAPEKDYLSKKEDLLWQIYADYCDYKKTNSIQSKLDQFKFIKE